MDESLTSALMLIGLGVTTCLASALASVLPPPTGDRHGQRARRLRVDPVSRAGGIAVGVPLLAVVVVAMASGLIAAPGAGALVTALLLAMATGWIDDLHPIGPAAKFAGQCLAAAALAVAVAEPAWVGGAESTVILVVGLALWSQNAWNFVDGSDGLMATAGIAVFTAGAGLSLAGGGDPLLVGLAAATAVALAGFLPWNLPRARLFLGDSGSLLIGAAYASCTVLGFANESWLGWAWIALAAPIHADVLVCLLRRLIRGCRWWEGHREHAYQQVVHRSGAHATAIRIGALLWCAVALPASVAAIWWGWPVAVAALAVCGMATYHLGSGTAVIEVSEPIAERVIATASSEPLEQPSVPELPIPHSVGAVGRPPARLVE